MTLANDMGIWFRLSAHRLSEPLAVLDDMGELLIASTDPTVVVGMIYREPCIIEPRGEDYAALMVGDEEQCVAHHTEDEEEFWLAQIAQAKEDMDAWVVSLDEACEQMNEASEDGADQLESHWKSIIRALEGAR